MNVEDEEVKLGQTLSQFKEFSADFDPTMKGLALSNSDEIRTVHNSFARQSVFEFDAKFAKEDDDVFHFVGNIKKARIYSITQLCNEKGARIMYQVNYIQKWILD